MSIHQKGIVQIFTLLILIAGLFAGLYLVQKTTNILPKAHTSENVEFSDLTEEEKRVEALEDVLDYGEIANSQEEFVPDLLPEETNLLPGFVNTCGKITLSGNYFLTQDISAEHKACMQIHDTSNVNFDCQNHSITSTFTLDEDRFKTLFRSMIVNGVQNFSIKNCSIHSIYPEPHDIQIPSLAVSDSDFGIIQNNTFGGGELLVRNGNNLEIESNTLNISYIQSSSSYNWIHDNDIISENDVVNLNNGRKNRVENNVIDGKWDGVNNSDIKDLQGADDGIILNGETEGIIANNTISNNYDCGIETERLIQNTKIENNRINKAGFCGIGGWYWNSWLGNTVNSNIIDNTPYMFFLFRIHGLEQSRNEQTVYFKDNTFTNNIFLNQRDTIYTGSPIQTYSSWINFQTLPRELSPSVVQLGNNVFRDNDFDINIAGPILSPASMILNGGGNKCGKIDDAVKHLGRDLICEALIP